MGCKATTRILTLEEIIGTSVEEFRLDGMLVIGEDSPSAEEIVYCRVEPKLTQVNVAKDAEGVEVRGVVDVSCVYVGRNSPEAEAAFTSVRWEQALTFHRVIEIPGTEDTMLPYGEVCVTGMSQELQPDGRTVDIHLDLRVDAKVTALRRPTIIEEVLVTEPEKAKVDKEQVRVDEVMEQLKAEAQAQGTYVLEEGQPAVGRVLSYSAVPRVNSTSLDGDWVVVDGDVEYKVIYVVEEEQRSEDAAPVETTLEEELYNSEWAQWQQETAPIAVQEKVAVVTFRGVSPFVCRMEARHTKEGMRFHPQVTLRDLTVQGEGRELAVSCKLELQGNTIHRHKVTLVKDVVSSQGREVSVRKEFIPVTEVGSEGLARRKAELTVDIPEGKPAVEQILDMTAKVWTEDYQVLEDRVLVEVGVFLEAWYTPHDGGGYAPMQMASWNVENQVTMAIELPVNDTTMHPDLELSVESVDWDLVTRGQIEVSLIIQANCTLKNHGEREVAVELVLVEPEEDRPPSYRFVIVQPGDTLWKLAAKYRTTVQRIIEANQWLLEQQNLDDLQQGWKLLIPTEKVSELRPIS